MRLIDTNGPIVEMARLPPACLPFSVIAFIARMLVAGRGGGGGAGRGGSGRTRRHDDSGRGGLDRSKADERTDNSVQSTRRARFQISPPPTYSDKARPPTELNEANMCVALPASLCPFSPL